MSIDDMALQGPKKLARHLHLISVSDCRKLIYQYVDDKTPEHVDSAELSEAIDLASRFLLDSQNQAINTLSHRSIKKRIDSADISQPLLYAGLSDVTIPSSVYNDLKSLDIFYRDVLPSSSFAISLAENRQNVLDSIRLAKESHHGSGLSDDVFSRIAFKDILEKHNEFNARGTFPYNPDDDFSHLIHDVIVPVHSRLAGLFHKEKMARLSLRGLPETNKASISDRIPDTPTPFHIKDPEKLNKQMEVVQKLLSAVVTVYLPQTYPAVQAINEYSDLIKTYSPLLEAVTKREGSIRSRLNDASFEVLKNQTKNSYDGAVGDATLGASDPTINGDESISSKVEKVSKEDINAGIDYYSRDK